MILPESLSVLRNTPEANSTLSAAEDGEGDMNEEGSKGKDEESAEGKEDAEDKDGLLHRV